MINLVRNWLDKYRGLAEHAITIPVFDGPLKPNRILEDAAVEATMDGPEDLATDGHVLYAANGMSILRLEAKPAEVCRFDQRITALACTPGGGHAVALDGRVVRMVGGAFDGKEWSAGAGQPFVSINAISASASGKLYVTDGSSRQPAENWCHDLMERGRTGRVLELDPTTGSSRQLGNGLEYAWGCIAAGDRVLVSETWKHRVVALQAAKPPKIVLDWLPAYPCRLTPASDGGFWLSALAGRTQLVEFVLREDAYRKRMIKEIDPAYWIAPALNSGSDFLEPMQSAGVKMRGVLKPYAPPRSYGLVIKLGPDGSPVTSFHSRLDGKNHGVIAAVECRGALYVLSKGSGRILRLPVGAN